MSRSTGDRLGKEIGVSVREVLDLEALKGSAVLAGGNNLEGIVSSINVMEVPDIVDWVGRGEIIITTAYAIKGDVKVLLELIPLLKQKGVAALGIKSQRYIGKIPSEIIHLAAELSFPLFEIPSGVSFSQIITEVLTAILDSQNKVLKDIQDLNKALTKTMLNGGNLQEICQTLYDRFGNSVAISSDYISAIVMSANPKNEVDIGEILLREKSGRFSKGTGERDYHTQRIKGDILGNAGYERIVIPIISDNINYGQIYMWEDNMEMTNVHISIMESVTILIALELVKRASMGELENNQKLGFIQKLLSDNQKEHQQALQIAHHFDFNISASHRVLVVKGRDRSDGNAVTSEVKYRINNVIVGILQYLQPTSPIKMLFTISGDNVIILWEYPKNIMQNAYKSTLILRDKLIAQLRQSGLLGLVSIGVGRIYEQSFRLYKSFDEGGRAAYYSGLVKGDFTLFQEMGLYRLLIKDHVDDEMKSFCRELLEPLIRHDKDKDSHMVKTLKSYYSCRGNMTQLSKELGIHYNTVVYRLQKIAELTGLDLDNEENLLNLQIALKINELIKSV